MASLLSALSCQETPISSQFKTPPPKLDNDHSSYNLDIIDEEMEEEEEMNEEMNMFIKKNINYNILVKNEKKMNMFIINNIISNKMNLLSDIPPFPSLGYDNTTSVVSRVSHDVEEVD